MLYKGSIGFVWCVVMFAACNTGSPYEHSFPNMRLLREFLTGHCGSHNCLAGCYFGVIRRISA
jgi:hypothetical protein